MVYVVTKQSPSYRQMDIEDLLFGEETESSLIRSNFGNTKTTCYEELPARLAQRMNKRKMIDSLVEFNRSTQYLRERSRESLYDSFFIPKNSGGMRRIDAPKDELMEALRKLKELLECNFNAAELYHTTAFAYIKKRSTVDAIKRHQENNSRWYAKFDLSNFFGNTTIDFVMRQLSMIFPFSEILKTSQGRAELEKALDLGFLNGGLPQGTPLSPLLTNIIMIPIDHILSNSLRNLDDKRYIYTRYADDFIISCRYSFNHRFMERMIENVLFEFGATFTLNREKTRYGSTAGRNFNLGLMVTADNRITIGNAKKRRIEMLMRNYAIDIRNGNRWSVEDAQVFSGQLSYFRMVEPDVYDRILSHINNKFAVDITAELKIDLK